MVFIPSPSTRFQRNRRNAHASEGEESSESVKTIDTFHTRCLDKKGAMGKTPLFPANNKFFQSYRMLATLVVISTIASSLKQERCFFFFLLSLLFSFPPPFFFSNRETSLFQASEQASKQAVLPTFLCQHPTWVWASAARPGSRVLCGWRDREFTTDRSEG